MLTITLANGRTYPVLQNTAVYPSGSSAVRSYMEIYMEETAMTSTAFEKLFTVSENTAEIHIVNEESGSDIGYFNYAILANVGKKRISRTDSTTGETAETMALYVRLEQLTYIEQKLAKLGISV
jgi:hypothetical protein